MSRGSLFGVRDFKKLEAWRAARALAREVYSATASMPAGERYAMTDQMRRAALSIPSNIAEGSGRPTRTDYARFVGIAGGSANELESLLLIAGDLQFLQPRTVEELTSRVASVRAMCSKLREALKRR